MVDTHRPDEPYTPDGHPAPPPVRLAAYAAAAVAVAIFLRWLLGPDGLAEVLGAAALPAAVVWIAMAYRAPLTERIRSLRKAKVGGQELEFDRHWGEGMDLPTTPRMTAEPELSPERLAQKEQK